MSDRELLEMALEALMVSTTPLPIDRHKVIGAIEALRAHLAAPRPEPEPEPVAYFDLQKQVFYWTKPTMIDVPMTVALKPLPLYAAPLADAAIQERIVSHGEAAIDAAMDASTAQDDKT